jgi:hypothetical protein
MQRINNAVLNTILMVCFLTLSACGGGVQINKRPAVVSLTALRVQAAQLTAECYATTGTISANTVNPAVWKIVAEMYGVCEFDQQATSKLDQMLTLVNEAENEDDKAEILATVKKLAPQMKNALENGRKFLGERMEEILECLEHPVTL